MNLVSRAKRKTFPAAVTLIPSSTTTVRNPYTVLSLVLPTKPSQHNHDHDPPHLRQRKPADVSGFVDLRLPSGGRHLVMLTGIRKK